MADSEILVGIAGTGFIGPTHLEALRRINVRVFGLAESTPELAQKKALELGIEHSYASFEDMVADPRITCVHLATPNRLHYPQARAALLAGKHVVCEKPLAMNSQESSELVKLAAEKKLVNVTNFNIRYYPLVQQSRAMVQAGELGSIYILQGSYQQDWLLFDTDWNWRLEPHMGGPLRAVADIGSHCLDALTYITGLQVEEVFADLKIFVPVRKKPIKSVETYSDKLQQSFETVDQPIATEDYGAILLHYENGARGVVTVSQVSAGRKNRLFFEINGSKSALAWDSENPNDLWLGRRNAPNALLGKNPNLVAPEVREGISFPGGHAEGFPDTFKHLFAKVYRYIRQGNSDATPDFPTFADGHYEMLLCEAVERSVKERTWAKVGH